jgi:hypothetical protein
VRRSQAQSRRRPDAAAEDRAAHNKTVAKSNRVTRNRSPIGGGKIKLQPAFDVTLEFVLLSQGLLPPESQFDASAPTKERQAPRSPTAWSGWSTS